MKRTVTLSSCLCLLLVANALSAEPTPEALQFFESKIRPVLVKTCYQCHSANAKAAGKLQGGLRLDTRETIRKGGKNGPAVVPGDPAKSLLIKALRHESVKMPPKSKLPDDVIANFEKWVKSGAADPRDGAMERQRPRHPESMSRRAGNSGRFSR